VTLVLIVGGVGSGKTLLATIIASQWATPPVVNYRVEFPADQLDLNLLLTGKYQARLVVLDEAYVYLESRLSGRALNRALSYVLFQSRKRALELILTAQLSSSLDIRFRSMVDVLVEASAGRDGFRYRATTFGSDWAGVQAERIFWLPYERASLFYPIYDTMETVEPPGGFAIVQREVMKPKDKRELAREHARKAHEEFSLKSTKHLTRAQVKMYLELYQIPNYLSDLIYFEDLSRVTRAKKKSGGE